MVLVYAVVVALIVDVFLTTWGFRGPNPRYGFEAMYTFKAHRPFAYRVLMPLIIRGVDAATPFIVVKAEVLDQKNIYRRWGWEREIDKPQVIAYFLLLLFLFGAVWCARLCTKYSYPLAAPPLQDLMPAVALLFLPLTFIQGGYMYDFPELFFLFASTAALLRQNWLIYYLLYPLAVVNKESGALIAVYFVALNWREMARGRLLKHLTAQALIAVPVIALIRLWAGGNPGQAMEVHLQHNLDFLLDPRSYLAFFDIYVPLVPVPRGFNLLSVATVLFLIIFRWRVKPLPLRRLLIGSTAVVVPLYLVGSVEDEIRALSLAFVPLYLLGFDTVQSLYAGTWPPPAPDPRE